MYAVNIPADGLFLAIFKKANGDLSAENCSSIIKEYIQKYLDCSPDIILLNVCYRRSLTPSEVFDTYLYNIKTDENGFALKDSSNKTIKELSPVCYTDSVYFNSFFEVARPLLMQGIDIYKVAVDLIKESGCKVFLSLRMNDGHFTDNMGVNSSFALKNGAENTFDGYGRCLDFSKTAVQNYFAEYIKELLTAYDIDGIELDWLRSPGILPANKRNDYSILNNFMAYMRRLLDSKSDRLGLAVRLITDEKSNLDDGIDVAQWIADGNTDILTIENFYIPTCYEMPVEKWRKSIAEKNTSQHPYTLFCGSDWGVGCRNFYAVAMNPALVRGFANECLSRGADGVYLFNFFEDGESSSLELSFTDEGIPLLKNCFKERILAANCPEALPRRWVHIGSSNERYPIVLKSFEDYSFKFKPQQPYQRLNIIIGLNQEVSPTISINDIKLSDYEKIAPSNGFEYDPHRIEKSDEAFVYSVTQTAPAVWSFDVPCDIFSDDMCIVEIKNISCTTYDILWIELLYS